MALLGIRGMLRESFGRSRATSEQQYLRERLQPMSVALTVRSTTTP